MRYLVVEDEELDRMAIQRALPGWECVEVKRVKEFAVMEDRGFDFVLWDYGLPDSYKHINIDAARFELNRLGIPLFIISGQDDLDIDYYHKNQPGNFANLKTWIEERLT